MHQKSCMPTELDVASCSATSKGVVEPALLLRLASLALSSMNLDTGEKTGED